MKQWLALFSLLSVVFSCTAEITPPKGDTKTEFKSPKESSSLASSLESFDLPVSFQNSSRFFVEKTPSGAWLLAGNAGLYLLSSGTFASKDTEKIVGLVPLVDADGAHWIVVAKESKLSLWNEDYVVSELDTAFSDDKITSIQSKNEKEFWIGTQKGLWLYSNNKIAQVSGVSGVIQLGASQSADVVVVQDTTGAFYALKKQGTSWSSQNLSDEEHQFAGVVPFELGASFWGLEKEKIFLRVKESGEEKARWWPFYLDAKKEATQQPSIQKIFFNAKDGSVWLLNSSQVFQITGSSSSLNLKQLTLLSSTLQSITVSSDNAVWFLDTKKLHKMGGSVETKTFTYTKDLQPFLNQNCSRCHFASGIASKVLFENYADVVSKIDKLIDAVENKRMPSDGKALVGGDRDLLRKWKEQGLKE